MNIDVTEMVNSSNENFYLPTYKIPVKVLNPTVFERTDRNNIKIKVHKGMLKYCFTINLQVGTGRKQECQ